MGGQPGGQPRASFARRRPWKVGVGCCCCAMRRSVAWRASWPDTIRPRRANGCHDKSVAAVVAVFGSGTCAQTRRVERARDGLLPWSGLAAGALRAGCRWQATRFRFAGRCAGVAAGAQRGRWVGGGSSTFFFLSCSLTCGRDELEVR